MIKYIRKLIDVVKPDSKNIRTLALCWAFRKKSFGISKKFVDLIRALRISSSKVELIQTELGKDGMLVVDLPMVVWNLKGFCFGLVDKFVKISYEEYRSLCNSSSFSEFVRKRRSDRINDVLI